MARGGRVFGFIILAIILLVIALGITCIVLGCMNGSPHLVKVGLSCATLGISSLVEACKEQREQKTTPAAAENGQGAAPPGASAAPHVHVAEGKEYTT